VVVPRFGVRPVCVNHGNVAWIRTWCVVDSAAKRELVRDAEWFVGNYQSK